MREINFYKTATGRCPVEEFLDSLASKQVQKLAWVMQLVEEITQPSTQYLKKLTNTNDIWEIRAQTGSDIFRILGFFATNDLFIAVHGFQKKSQKVHQSEIRLAENRKKVWYTQQEDKRHE